MLYDQLIGTNGVISDSAVGDASEHVATNRTLFQSVRLDDIYVGKKIDIVKIDVEGAEYRALLGAEQTIKQSRPTIVSEIAPGALQIVSGVTYDACLRLLLDWGYELSVIQEHGTLQGCGQNIAAVVACYEQQSVDHIDIVATPAATDHT